LGNALFFAPVIELKPVPYLFRSGNQ